MTSSTRHLMPAHGSRAALRFVVASLWLVAATPASAGLFIVGTEGACTHTNLQAALDTAATSAGSDVVRIVRTVDWTQQQVSTTTNEDVEIVGGYETCSSTLPSGKTTLSGDGGAARSVIALRGNGHFRLRNLVIRDGDQAGDDDGGGIHFLGGGTVEISESEVVENEAEDGGGIYAQGTTTLAELIIGANVLIGSNVARRHGGGVVAQNLEMSMIAPGSMLFMNTAGGRGGGLIVASGEFASYAYIGSNGVGDFGAVYGNHASIGGGISVLVGDDSERIAEVQVFSTDPNRPARIRGNSANLQGGGLEVRPDAVNLTLGTTAYAKLLNVLVEDNQAPAGAAIHLSTDSAVTGFNPNAVLLFNFLRPGETFHPAAAECPVGSPCGGIRDNGTQNTTGAVIQMANNSDFRGSRLTFERNRGGWLFYAAGDSFTDLELSNSLIAGNTVENSLIRDDEPQENGLSSMQLHHLTITGNTIGAAAVLSINEDLVMTRSLVDQPGKILLAPGGPLPELQYNIVNQPNSPQGTSNAAARFVDAANGDFMPRAGSYAVDLGPASGGFPLDMLSRPRVVDIAPNPNESGPVDAGAIERQELYPLVMNPYFHDDLTFWSPVTSATWDGTQDAQSNPASGSARVEVTTGIGGDPRAAAGLTQCLHFPGPGAYKLNGTARVTPTSNPPLASSRASLSWQVHYDGSRFGCGQGAPDQSGVHPLATTSAWTRPSVPAYIVIPAAQWTPNTSVTVTFDVQGPANSTTTTAWFDNIILDEGAAPLPESLFANGFE
jgi:hypothetical protein